MHGHIPITRKLESWWEKHGGQHADASWIEWLDTFNDMLRVKVAELASEHTNLNEEGQTVFGMAGIGSCTRKEGLKVLGFTDQTFSGSTRFTFTLGHIVEVMALATLHVSGTKVEGQQGTISIGDYCSSAPDGVVKLLGRPTVVSVKSIGYKMSGRTRKKGGGFNWRRQGFAELPFGGVYKTHVDHYMQIQAEMLALGLTQGLMLYVAKDLIKVFENDEYLGEGGNGSLTFYTELVQADESVQSMIIESLEGRWKDIQDGEAGSPSVYTYNDGEYMPIVQASYDENNIWGGPNQAITGTFNPCGGCGFAKDGVCLSNP